MTTHGQIRPRMGYDSVGASQPEGATDGYVGRPPGAHGDRE
jgi:hypothetical protein